MKKALVIVTILWILGGTALLAGIRLEVKGAYFRSENDIFRDIYGPAFKYGLEAGVDILENLSLWAGAETLKKTGSLTLTKEETKVWITPLALGVRYEIPISSILRLHVGGAAQYVMFKEDSVLGTVEENDWGFLAKGGGVVRLNDSFGIELFAAWSTCKMARGDVAFKVGGLDFGGGIEVRF